MLRLPAFGARRQPGSSYLGLMVTVNELLEMFVSLPLKLPEPVAEKTPACVGTKLTDTSHVWPPGRLSRLQVSVPPKLPAGTPPHVPTLAVPDVNWKLAGSCSVNTTFEAVALPVLFLICQVKVSPVPWFGPPFWAEPFTSRSALPPPVPPPTPTTPTTGGLMLVVELATLFPPTVSTIRLPDASRNWTEAVFVTAVAPAIMVNVTLALLPESIPPRLQLKFAPVCVHTPWLVAADWKAPGSVSVRVTIAASPGPLFVIVMVKVRNDPALMLAGEVIAIERSAPSAPVGVTAAEGADSALLPVTLVACTVNV